MCEEGGYTFVAYCLLGCSPGPTMGVGRERLSILPFFLSLFLLIGLCYFAPLQKSQIKNHCDTATLSGSPSRISLPFT